MRIKPVREMSLHAVILIFAALTLAPLFFTLNNSFRTNTEMYHSFFGVPQAFISVVNAIKAHTIDHSPTLQYTDDEGNVHEDAPSNVIHYYTQLSTRGYRQAWSFLHTYMLNSLFVSIATALSVSLLGSISAYLLARYHFPGSKAVFLYFIAAMMFPAVLTLVPSFLLIKSLGLLNTYWALLLPYIATGQVFAVFVFKSFFDGLPEDLFEAARIDGAGHLKIYWNVVLPLSKPVISVVMVMNILGTWNNFLWPFITNTDNRRHVIASGLYVLGGNVAVTGNAGISANYSTLFAAYMISSIPLLVLFIYSTKPFIQGVTSGAFKA